MRTTKVVSQRTFKLYMEEWRKNRHSSDCKKGCKIMIIRLLNIQFARLKRQKIVYLFLVVITVIIISNAIQCADSSENNSMANNEMESYSMPNDSMLNNSKDSNSMLNDSMESNSMENYGMGYYAGGKFPTMCMQSYIDIVGTLFLGFISAVLICGEKASGMFAQPLLNGVSKKTAFNGKNCQYFHGCIGMLSVCSSCQHWNGLLFMGHSYL